MMFVSTGLSKRGNSNVDKILPKISSALADKALVNVSRIDMSTSENWLIRPELVAFCKKAISKNLSPLHLSYPDGFSGDKELLSTVAKFLNTYFKPSIEILPNHLVTAPGAASCLDAILYNICDPGDGILIPAPFWNGFDWLFGVRSSVKIVMLETGNLQSTFTMDLISAMERAVDESDCPIKGVILTNPHNPLGQCYPEALLEECMRFCHKHGIHFITDEVYALSTFQTTDHTESVPFTSALSINVERLGCDRSKVHTVWSMSKDFGVSGFRLGVSITQQNPTLTVGLALASNFQISSLSAIFASSLLSSPELPELLALNSSRLSEAYTTVTSFLKQHNIEYIPANAGMFIFAKLVPHAKSWDDEFAMIAKLKEAGVSVSGGHGYHVMEEDKGWARLAFALNTGQLREALKRIDGVLSGNVQVEANLVE